MTDRLRVILDVDTGIDDSLAILYACASPEIDLEAVTCVAGNVPGRQVADNTRALLELAGRGDVPVALGAERPLVKPLQTTEETHGPRGIGHARLPVPTRALEAEDAADLIVSAARRRPGTLHLVTLGPMTNLALALSREPRLPSLLARWTFMGGAFRVPGNTTPTAEWNLYVDPDAAKACLAAWAAALAEDPALPLPLGMCLDVTELARMLPADVARLARRAGAAPHDAAALESAGAPMLPVGTVASSPMRRKSSSMVPGGSFSPSRSRASGVGMNPIGVSTPLPWPRTRSKIHLRTRMFSPKPGQRKLPFSSVRNQLT